jgi:uncharacterized protein DUF669
MTSDNEWGSDPEELGVEESWDEGDELGDLRVNFSQKEAEAEAFDNLPSGKYHVRITSVEVKRSTTKKNWQKPYYACTYVVVEGAYEGRKIFDNVMLFEGALYSLSGLMKALGLSVAQGSIAVPKPDELLEQEFVVKLSIQPKRTVKDEEGNDVTYDARNQVKGYYPIKVMAGKVVGGSSSIDDLAP